MLQATESVTSVPSTSRWLASRVQFPTWSAGANAVDIIQYF